MHLLSISIRFISIRIFIATQVWCSRVSLHIEVSWYTKHIFNIYVFTSITKLLVVHIYSIITLAFRNISISMSNQITNDWIIFDISKFKTSYTIYYILLNFANLFYELVVHCWPLNDIVDCEECGVTVTQTVSLLSLGKIPVCISLENLSMCNKPLFKNLMHFFL